MTSIEHESERPMEDSQDSARSRQNFDERLKSASIVRALDLPGSYEVFFLNWPLDATGRTLEKTVKSCRFCSTVEDLLESLDHDQAPLPIVSSAPRDKSHPDKSELKEREPIVIFADLVFDAESDREIFFAAIMPSILKKGGLVITRQDWDR